MRSHLLVGKCWVWDIMRPDACLCFLLSWDGQPALSDSKPSVECLVFKSRKSICDKVFSTKVEMETHVSFVHEGKKKFKCSICEATFVRKRGLKNHTLFVHEEKKFHECKLCSWEKCFIKPRVIIILVIIFITGI